MVRICLTKILRDLFLGPAPKLRTYPYERKTCIIAVLEPAERDGVRPSATHHEYRRAHTAWRTGRIIEIVVHWPAICNMPWFMMAIVSPPGTGRHRAADQPSQLHEMIRRQSGLCGRRVLAYTLQNTK